MALIKRAAWHARPATGEGNAINANPFGVAVHWSGANVGTHAHALCGPRVLAIQRHHQITQGWSDIAYTFVVCQHSFVYEGRGVGKGSAANGSTEANFDYYAVCALLGPDDTPTPQLLAGIGEAIGLCRKAGANLRVLGHQDLFNTACPGPALYAWVKAGMPVTAPKSPPPPAPTPRKAPTMLLIKGADTDKVYVTDGMTKRHVGPGEVKDLLRMTERPIMVIAQGVCDRIPVQTVGK